MKLIALFFIFLSFGLESRAGFFPYNPGPGYLPPAYSYQQQPFQQQGYYQQQPYQQQGYYQQQPFYQQRPIMTQRGGGSSCFASSCGTLKGFKQCLASPSSPYRYFIFHPEGIKKDVRAFQRLRAFTTVHPNCYAQFCNRVCSAVPNKFQPAPVQQPHPQQFPDDESMSEFSDSDSSVNTASQGSRMPSRSNTPLNRASWLSRQKDWLQQNDLWKAREFEKRSGVQGQIGELCARKDLIGEEIRLLCSECAPYLKSDRKMIPACQKEVNYEAPVREQQAQGRRVGQPQGPSKDWGLEGLKSHKVTNPQGGGDVFTNAQGETIRIVNGRAITIGRQGEGTPSEQAKKRQSQAQIDAEIQQQERADAASETASQTSRSSQGSKKSATSQSSQSLPLTTGNVEKHSQPGQRQPIQEWGGNIPQSAPPQNRRPAQQQQRRQPPSESEGSEDAFSEESSDEGDDQSEASSDFSEDE